MSDSSSSYNPQSYAFLCLFVLHNWQGPGGFDFLSVDGLPVLSDVNTGRFNGAHQPKLFVEAYAPEAHWYARHTFCVFSSC